MLSRYFPVFLLLIATSVLHAQNNNEIINIQGPEVTCGNDCDTLILTVQNIQGTFPPPYTYKWIGPGGYSSTQRSIFLCPVIPGIYSVIVASAAGDTASASHTIYQLPYQPLNIVSSNTAPCNGDSSAFFCEKICPNTTITYSVQTDNPVSQQIFLNWQVTGASSYQVNNPPFNTSVTVNWGSAGNGFVSVFTVGTGGPIVGGCGGEDALCVTIIEAPNAQFTTDPAPASSGALTVCKGQTVYFDNQSTAGDYYEWAFSDDFSTTYEIDPQHVFQTPGNYTVRLIAQSNCLCSDTMLMNVTVLDAISPTLDCVGTICPNETVTYTAGNGCAPFSWAVTSNGTILNGGTPAADSITVQWTSGPAGTITLGAQPCAGATCPQPAVIHIPVISDAAEIQGKERVCANSEERYSIEPYAGTSFVWSLSSGGSIVSGQGTNQVTVSWTAYPNPGQIHWLSVKYDNCYLGCGGQDSIAVRILSPFIIEGPVEACAGASAGFNAKLTTPIVNLLANWTLTGPNGSAVWNSATAAASVNVPFATAAGLYQLLAVPADPSQTCSDEATWTINVAPLPDPPTSISGPTPICPNNAYTYEALSVSANSALQWTVENGPALPGSYVGNPLNITWNASGPYSLAVRQISTDGLGCLSDTIRLDVVAINLPNITGDDLVCEDETVPYTIADLEDIDIQWSTNPVGAGAIASGQGSKNVEIFWTQSGSHTLSANVCGQIATLPVTVLVNPKPVVQAPASVCIGQIAPVQTAIPYTAYSWKSENGTVVGASAIANLSDGSYAVQVTDNQGCAGVQEFTIDPAPNPNLNITTADFTGFCNNSNFVTISALSSTDGDFQYQWFRDGVPVGGNTPTYTTNQYGLYTATVTNQYGCTTSDGPIAIINDCTGGGGVPGPVAPVCPPGSLDLTIIPTTLCDSFSFQVSGAQYVAGSATWLFAESGAALLGTSNLDNPGFHFQNAGQYLVILSGQLLNGATCRLIDSVKVVASAQFGLVPDCPGGATTFEDVSTFLPGGSISSWAWDFGDPASGAGNTSTIRAPNHIYAASGNYPVTLTITANSGCTSSITQAAMVPTTPSPTFALPAQNCAGNALPFQALAGPEITSITWDFGQPATGPANDATGNPAYHSFTPAGTYPVMATATNVFGCIGSATQNVTVTPNILTGNISPANPAPICEGSTVTLTAPAGGVAWFWSDSTTTTATLITGDEGTYRVTITDANGCTYTPPPVTVEVKPAPDAVVKALLENELGQVVGTAYPALTTCAGEDVHLEVQGNSSYGYVWSDGNGSDNEVFFTEDRFNLLSVGTHVFTVTVTDFSNGCTSVTDPFIVTVNPVPSGFSIATNSICAQTASITYTGPTPANWQFIWNNGETGTTLSAAAPGLYFIRAINEFGCEARSNSVYIQPGPPVNAIPGGCHTRCRPDTLCLPTNLPYVASWQWYYDGSPIAGATGPDLIATQSGTYWAVLTDAYGCMGQSDPLSLQLFDAYGNVTGQVWSDVNDNGLIDAADTLVSGIPVDLYQNGSPVAYGQSNPAGTYAFTNIFATNYVVQIDAASLPAQWQIVIGQKPANMAGCQTLATADLLVKFVCQSIASNVQLGACPGGSALYQGTAIPTGGSQSFVLTTAQGCDSTVTVTVQALPVSTSALTLTACNGGMVTYNGVQLNPGTVQNFVLQNQLGCDSTVTVTVQTAPTSAANIILKACAGGTVAYNGVQLSSGTVQDFIFQNYLGCDSTVTVTVQTAPTSAANITLKACSGSTVAYNGAQLSSGTVQDFIFQNYLGCDSTVTVTVQAAQNSASLLTVTACPGEAYDYAGAAVPAGETREFNFTNAAGCDSVVTLVVTALPVAAFTLQADPSCAAQPTGSLLVRQAQGGLAPYQFSLNGGLAQADSLFEALAAGNYQVILEDANGCTVAQSATIGELPRLEVVLADAFLPCDSSGISLAPIISGDTTALTFRWWNGQTVGSTLANEAGAVWLEATNQCETVRRDATVEWTEIGADKSYMYVPNVFAPSGEEAENTVFRPVFAKGLTLLDYHLEIYDRWGNLMFQSTQAEAGWEGSFHRRTMVPGVYVWQVEAKLTFCGRNITVRKQGDVTIVR